MNKHARSGLLTAALAAMSAMTVGIGEAQAVIISATGIFLSDHCTDGCLTGQANGGTLTVTDNQAGTLSFNIQLANGNQFINGGFDASFGFNLTDNPSITYSGITPAGSFTLPNSVGNVQTAGNLHMDGTGFFEYGLEGIGNGGSDPLGSSLVFSISAPGLDLIDLDPNALGQFFAADIISGTTGRTGAIDISASPVINTPEPATLALFGSGLLGLGMIRRRR